MSEPTRTSSANGAEPATAEPQPRGDAPIGGQAVLEGVMMRGVSTWAVAVRAPTPEQIEGGRELEPEEAALGEIEIHSEPLVSLTRRHRALRLPVIRGVVALVESMKLGFRALAISANAQLSEDQGEIGGKTWAGTVAASLIFGIALFFLLPAGITSLFGDALPNSLTFVIIEKLIRIGIFLLYIFLISRMRDLQRVFEYHGAEHKTISCYEAGLPLTPENAQGFSRLHPRCGTSFLLIVMIVAIVVFAPLGRPVWYLLFASRIIGIPLVAGLSFEVLKLFGRKRDKAWARALMWPGLQLQRLTTREPDLDQLAVSIAALEAVLAVEDPTQASEEDKVGMEVVA
ncbi:DUF1385 domain-containing protein [soil metagenome]|jgi:uncharacterized protein YqhQ|nr:DUF1385 domain-containing protein [Actinomycetota bacterium]MDQ3356407.1 DUF1385 domain-containing protein [Actinomycetota bacterium]